GIIKIDAALPAPPVNYKPNILFTEIKAGKDTLNMIAASPTFSYKKNDVFFQWAVPTFIDEKQTLFSYKLQGNDWSEPSHEAAVRFVNLSPGKYTLRIKAIFPNGLYAGTTASYSFEILAPWWQQWWFRILAMLAACAVIVLLVRGYVRRKLERQRIFLEKQQAIEKERSRIASDMHDDLGAGLSTIRFLSEKVKRNATGDVAKHEIEKIAGISVELVENMNEIIWAMNEKNDTLEDLLFYTRSYAKEYCEDNHLQCVVDFPEQVPAVFVSGELRRNVFLTVKESLHNIVKYANATQVDIRISAGDRLTVIIRDNGKGFSINPENISGGNGLKNMRKRIESIGGSFFVMNGSGVTITMQAPLKAL
ncbi:MAG TPA: histidine kinase, partial [Chitinophagaceae bacterium]|nr:histidine kinase [Chitinophagaceae bacterium]